MPKKKLKDLVYRCRYEDLPEWVDKDLLPNNGAGKEWADYLIIEPTHTVYSTACEPEDFTFYRDLAWVVTELNLAYNKIQLLQKQLDGVAEERLLDGR